MGKRDSYVMVPEDDPRWVKFWNHYPRRDAKKDGRKAFATWNPTMADVEACVEALAWQIPLHGWDDADPERRRYVPLPASYIRAERWTDEPPRQVQKADDYGHVPPCHNHAECIRKSLNEIRAKAGKPLLLVNE